MESANKRRRTDNDKLQLESLVKQGENDQLKCIIRNSNATDLTRSFGLNLLDLAAKHNNLDLLKFLLTLDFDVNAQDSSGSTPLLFAASHGNFEAVEILLDANADVCLSNSMGKSAFEILMNKKEMVSADLISKCLQRFSISSADVQKKADILIESECSLKLVLSLKNAVLTQAVLERKNIISDKESEEAVNLAMVSLDVDNVRALLHHGAGVDIRRTKFFSNLHDMSKGRHPKLIVFETFIRIVVDLNILSGETIFIFNSICENGCEEAIRILLKYDIDVYARNCFECYILPSIFYNAKVNVIDLLKDRQSGVLLCRPSHLWFLCLKGKISMKKIQYLLDLDVDLNYKGYEGGTLILNYRVWKKNCLGKMFLQRGADVQAIDNFQRTVFNFASPSQIVNNILPQLSIVEAQGTPILQQIRNKFSYVEYKRVYEDYCKQVAGFKGYELSESVTLFTVLTEKSDKVARLLRDKNVTPLVDVYCCENKIHSYYSSMLKMKLERASNSYFSKFNIVRLVSMHTGREINFDHLVLDKIFSFLTYRDMITFASVKIDV